MAEIEVKKVKRSHPGPTVEKMVCDFILTTKDRKGCSLKKLLAGISEAHSYTNVNAIKRTLKKMIDTDMLSNVKGTGLNGSVKAGPKLHEQVKTAAKKQKQKEREAAKKQKEAKKPATKKKAAPKSKKPVKAVKRTKKAAPKKKPAKKVKATVKSKKPASTKKSKK